MEGFCSLLFNQKKYQFNSSVSEQDKEPEQVTVSEVVGSGPSEECATQKKIVKADAYVAACDVPRIKRLVPCTWREWEFFDNIYELVGVLVVTVQLRYNGWVTELQDLECSRQVRQAAGLDNLLYTPDADFLCFADLALASPEDYYVGADKNLLVKDHTHTFVNKGGEIGELDFRFPIGAPLHGIRAFLSTNQLK
ncbi:unnamed protein product [Camellia sinensis]